MTFDKDDDYYCGGGFCCDSRCSKRHLVHFILYQDSRVLLNMKKSSSKPHCPLFLRIIHFFIRHTHSAYVLHDPS